MKQPTVMDLFDKMNFQELNDEKGKIIDDKITSKNINTSDIKERGDNSNGIIETKNGNEIYRTWKVEFIRPKITKFLKTLHQDSLITPEIDRINTTIFDRRTDEIIPVEIQRTLINKKQFMHTHFENVIRKQIESNIKYSGKCWFFFDSEYLRYLQNYNLNGGSDIDMTWLVNMMKENILKVFSIKYDGSVKELTIEDFDYIKLSEDQIVLNTNKLKIFRNVVHGYNFTQEEIDKYLDDFNKDLDSERLSFHCMKSTDSKCKLYGNILYYITHLNGVNNVLDMKCTINSGNGREKQSTIIFGIFDVVGTHGNANLVRFVGKFNVCKYFPGYIRNKEQWESYKGNNLTHSTFTMITNGSLKQHKTVFDF